MTEREEELKLGLLTYRGVLAGYCWEQADGSVSDLRERRPTLVEIAKTLRVAPRALFVDLPADIRQARAVGRLRQVEACVRGHWDGVRNRPVPLETLGLRRRGPSA